MSKFVCTACGKRGADVRPDFDWVAIGSIALNRTRWIPLVQ
jgi:hypothetical protein